MFARLYLLSLLFPVTSYSADLRLLSFNTCMLPPPIKKTLQGVRQNVIAAQLKDTNYDLLFFEEAFTGKFQKKLITQLKNKYPFHYYLHKEIPVYPAFGSGVFVMSHFPFKVLKTIHFEKCGGVDCYAAKGSVVIELTLPSGKTVQVAGAHLNSHGEAIKLEQFQEIKHMLNEVKKAGVPQILVGDLNTAFGGPSFTQALAIMDMTYTNLTTVPQITSGRANECYTAPKHGRWLDHVLVSANDASSLSTMEVVDLNFEYKGKVCPSSDHHAVKAELFFK